jgi:hypothetical protein
VLEKLFKKKLIKKLCEEKTAKANHGYGTWNI